MPNKASFQSLLGLLLYFLTLNIIMGLAASVFAPFILSRTGNDAAALVITRGAKINAAGTAEKPIIFTSELDNLNGNLTARDVGLWGGVVILGNAVIKPFRGRIKALAEGARESGLEF